MINIADNSSNIRLYLNTSRDILIHTSQSFWFPCPWMDNPKGHINFISTTESPQVWQVTTPHNGWSSGATAPLLEQHQWWNNIRSRIHRVTQVFDRVDAAHYWGHKYSAFTSTLEVEKWGQENDVQEMMGKSNWEPPMIGGWTQSSDMGQGYPWRRSMFMKFLVVCGSASRNVKKYSM